MDGSEGTIGFMLEQPGDNDTYSAATLEDLKVQERYEELGKWLNGYGKNTTFTSIVDKLGLDEDYAKYTSSINSLFSDIASSAPSLYRGEFRQSAQAAPENPNKHLLANWFCSAYDRMKITDFSQHPAAKPGSTYVYKDHQDKYVLGTRLKPDGVIYYSGQRLSARSVHMIIEAKLAPYTDSLLPPVVLGQLAEYACTVWKEQPTRTFFPVILLRGVNMSLFVLARSGYYRVEMGTYLFGSAFTTQSDISLNSCFLQDLWFLLKQPPNRFGHFADVSIDYEFLRFSGSVLDSKVEVVGLGNVSDVDVGDRITRHIPLIRRAAFLTKAKYRGMPAVLKYSWTPVDRLPEGAVYKVLESQNVSCLPNIYSSGILVKDVFGYRLEYLLMEDCGETIESRFSKISGPWVLPNLIKSVCADISDAITKTTECLVEAASAGVLHRDISAGNITIRNGQVRVIDWGYAKLTQPDSPKIQTIANEWGFDLGDVTKNENIQDGMTGTPLFMGIRVLFGHPTRSVIDDIESLFYVAMYALSHLSRGPSASPAFNVHENKAAAYVKLGSIISKELYLKIFGVKECSDDVKAQLDLLYQLLFYRDNQFIGEELTEGKAEARVVDTTIMRKIIGSDLADQIYRPQVDNDMPVENAPPKHKTRAAKTKKPAPKKPKLAPKKPKPADNSNNQDSIRDRLRPRPGRSTK